MGRAVDVTSMLVAVAVETLAGWTDSVAARTDTQVHVVGSSDVIGVGVCKRVCC